MSASFLWVKKKIKGVVGRGAKPGAAFTKDFAVTSKTHIGGSPNAMVYSVKEAKGDELFACKFISDPEVLAKYAKDAYQETKIMRNLNHPNILRLRDVYENLSDSNGGFIIVVTPLAKGGDLFNFIVRRRFLSEDETAFLMVQLLDAVMYLHEKGITHRDIKAENIFMMEENNLETLVIGDFGTAIKQTEEITGNVGTAYCVAPEVVDGKKYDKSVDVWSLGVLMYIALCGSPPFQGATTLAIIEKMQSSDGPDFSSGRWKLISEDARQFVARMLQKKPEDRPAVEELMTDPWLSKYFADDPAVASRQGKEALD